MTANKSGPASAADQARTLALLWGPQDRPGRSGLTVRAIVTGALALADAGGLEALSMRAIADRLGVGTMSLYSHVSGRPALIELMVDTVCGEVYRDLDQPADQRGGWRAGLTFIARRNWELFLRHQWLLQAVNGRPVLGPNVNRKYEAELQPLDGIGLTDVEMDSVLTLVLMHVEGMARWQVALQQVTQRSGESDVQWWHTIEPALAAVMDPSGFPLGSRVGAAAGEYHQSASDPVHALEFGIQRILDGIAALIDRPADDVEPAGVAP